MNSIGKISRNVLWFLRPEDIGRFAVFYVVYVTIGTLALMAQGAGIFAAFGLTFAIGIILTAMISATRPMQRFEKEAGNDKPLAWRLLFGPLRFSGEDDSEPPKSGDGPSSGVENEEFNKRMRKNQIESRKRATKKMHDKVIHTSLIVAIYCLLYWFASDSISGFFSSLFGSGGLSAGSGFGAPGDISFENPKELFIFGLITLVVFWFVLIVHLPRWLVFILLVGMSVMRIVLLMFGAMSSMWIMNIVMLPIFYGLMMVFMFGSIIWPFIQPIKFFARGDASWATPKGSMRGQPEARAIVETELAKFSDYAEGKSKRRPTRGMVFEGPPGTGKTLLAKEIGTEYNLAFIMADGAALSGAPLVNLIVEYWLKPKANKFADEYGGAVFFIDEGEVLFGVRQGMGGGLTPMSGIRDVWDVLPYDSIGCTSSCGIMYDSNQARERFWQLKSSLSLGKDPESYTHKFFLPIGMGGSGGAIFPFLTWLDGVGSPPFSETLKRRIVNDFLDGLLVIPPNIPFTQIPLRFSPAKPKYHNILFIIATNRAFMLDPAIRRPGRLGVSARFKTPNLESRKDIISLYIAKADKDGLVHPELLKEEAIAEFARATSGMSPAEIEAAINTAYDVRATHVNNMKRIKALVDLGVSLDNLLEADRKYWLRYEEELKNETWDDDRADMRSLLEARNALIYGKADPGLTTAEHREQTALHEYWGHLIVLKAALGDVMRPSVISVMPRGNSLGMVSHIPVEERDPKPQRFYEGLMRVSVGSTVAERFFLGENQPGVSGDLENATRIACFMAGKAGMSPYKCAKADKKRFVEIGESLISVSDGTVAYINPFAKDFVERILSNGRSRERVATMLGQAFVDDYRLIRANVGENYEFHKEVIAELLRVDELGGAKLESIWNKLGEILVAWDTFEEEQSSLWPDKIEKVENYFYNPKRKNEIEEVLAQ